MILCRVCNQIRCIPVLVVIVTKGGGVEQDDRPEVPVIVCTLTVEDIVTEEDFMGNFLDEF